jgi:hypothetical protein
MEQPRGGKPWTWVTWITGHLAGSAKCEWSPWYRSRFKYKKRANDFDTDAWIREHDQIVALRARELWKSGASVGVENDNSFNLKGGTAILSGKPDLIVMRGHDANVRDVKTGKERESDHWQVKTYLFALPRVVKNAAVAWRGTLEYRGDRYVDVQAPTPPEAAKIVSMMQSIGSDLEPSRTPSRDECGRCDIELCPDRDTSGPSEGQTEDF